MFKSKKAFSSFSTNDIEKAKNFYGQILGLKVNDDEMGNLKIDISENNSVLIYPKEDHTPATFTVLNFLTESVDKAVEDLNSKGVKMENYDESELKTDEKGIHRVNGFSVAWFKDPAGNILSVLNEL